MKIEEGITENGHWARGWDGELQLFSRMRIIIIAAFCQHIKQNLHFGKEFH